MYLRKVLHFKYELQVNLKVFHRGKVTKIFGGHENIGREIF